MCNELAGDTCTAGAFAHPAFLKDHHFHNLQSTSTAIISPPLLIRHAEPLFLSCSEIDHTFDVQSRRKALDILQGEKKTYNLQLFSGVEHGFALRGNMDNPYERKIPLQSGLWPIILTQGHLGYTKEESLRGITSWFDFWLAQ